MPTPLSPHNPRIEAVRDLRTPKGRRAAGRFAAEGPTLLEEARRSGTRPCEIYLSETALGRFDAGVYEADGVPVHVLPDRVAARLSDVETPSGIVAVFDLPAAGPATILARPGPVLLLAGVSDPGNAGTLVRSAEAFGAAGVLFGRGGADPFAPKVVRAAMGSIFRLPVAAVDADELLALAAAAERPVVATDLDGEDLRVVGIPANAVVAIGNERRGVRDWLPRWDRAVRIPQCDTTESLNAAVAGSIVLYESARVK
ncbi:MAG TPA: RNA methyltransferase [Candidatus Sulfotelmatobacter sp.]|nr:RNA methyltransferase [Candidatus Sulfotelmatobacter sp.]